MIPIFILSVFILLLHKIALESQAIISKPLSVHQIQELKELIEEFKYSQVNYELMNNLIYLDNPAKD
jgi:hypothetical protein